MDQISLVSGSRTGLLYAELDYFKPLFIVLKFRSEKSKI